MNKVLIDLKDDNFKTVGQIARCIQQGTPGGVMRVTYKGKSYIVRGGIRTDYWINI